MLFDALKHQHTLQVRLSLSQLQSEGQPQEVQEKALLALVALAIPAFQDCQEISEDLRDVLGKAAARNRDNAQRLLVFRALWSVSTVCDSPELFFGNDKIWESLLQSLQQEEDLDVRESGLGLLSALANQQTTAHFLWGDVDDEDDPQGERVREDIFANTLRSQPARIRGRALAVLAGSFARTYFPSIQTRSNLYGCGSKPSLSLVDPGSSEHYWDLGE